MNQVLIVVIICFFNLLKKIWHFCTSLCLIVNYWEVQFFCETRKCSRYNQLELWVANIGKICFFINYLQNFNGNLPKYFPCKLAEFQAVSWDNFLVDNFLVRNNIHIADGGKLMGSEKLYFPTVLKNISLKCDEKMKFELI